MTDRRHRRRRSQVAALVAVAVVVAGCGAGDDPEGQESSVEVPDGATVHVIRGSATAGDADVALSASVHDRDGVREADVHLADLREPAPREERISGPPGTVGRAGGFELTILEIEDVGGPGDAEAEGAVREVVRVAVRDVTD